MTYEVKNMLGIYRGNELSDNHDKQRESTGVRYTDISRPGRGSCKYIGAKG